MVTSGEILKRATSLEAYWRPRNDRINEWIRLETLYDENLESGYESAVTNDPATVMSLAIHLLSGQPVKHNIKVGGQDEAAFDKAGKLERALEGWWNLIDERSFFSGRDFVIRELAYWMLMGWYAVELGVRTLQDGRTLPIFDIHDPREAFQEYGARTDGLTTYVHKWQTTLAEAQRMALEGGVVARVSGDSTLPTQIYSIWEKRGGFVVNSTIMAMPNGASEWVRYEEVLERPDIPVLTGPVGGSPYRLAPTQLTSTDWQKRIGMSVLESNRVGWKNFNKYYSLLLEIAKNYAEPDKIKRRLEDAIGERRQTTRDGGNVYYTDDLNASISRDEPGRFPIEVAQVLDRLHVEAQKGGFPDALYGGLQIQLSGFAVSQILQAALHKLGPYKMGLQRVLKYADRWFLDEFKKQGDSIVLSGKAHGRGIFMEKFDPTDIPTEFANEVDVDLSLPSDMMERVALIRNAIPGNEPIMDILTALEDVLKVDDPKLVKERIERDVLRRDPAIMQLNAISAIRARAAELDNEGNKETAEMFRDYADFLVAQAGQRSGNKGATGRPELNPMMMPPEMTGVSKSQTRRMRNPGAPNLPQLMGLR